MIVWQCMTFVALFAVTFGSFLFVVTLFDMVGEYANRDAAMTLGVAIIGVGTIMAVINMASPLIRWSAFGVLNIIAFIPFTLLIAFFIMGEFVLPLMEERRPKRALL